MPASPTATIAMVAHDSRRYVGCAIASVLAQDFEDFELLVLDDRSTDGTWEEICGFSHPRLRRVRNESRLGEYANRNRAIELARGRYLMFIDADDYLYPHGLGFMVRMLEAFPRAALAIAQMPLEKFIYPVQLAPREFLACQFLGPCVTGHDFTRLFFRTEALRSCGGFDLRFRTGDTHIQLRLASREGALLVSDGVGWWRRKPGQASESLHAQRWGIAEYTHYGFELLDDPSCPLSRQEIRIAKANLARTAMRTVAHFARRGRLRHAMRLFEAAGLRWSDARFLFASEHRPHLSEVSGANPIGPSMPEKARGGAAGRSARVLSGA
jgi:glycosyltransferase involved in cell wall biosynthesis